VFVIAVIRYSRENLCISKSFGTKKWQYFGRYKREFVIAVIVITEFVCIFQVLMCLFVVAFVILANSIKSVSIEQ